MICPPKIEKLNGFEHSGWKIMLFDFFERDHFAILRSGLMFDPVIYYCPNQSKFKVYNFQIC